MSVIDLGEPSLYEPGEPPILRGYSSLSRSQRRRLFAVGALVILAGAVAGIAPPAEANPAVHSVGRVRGPLTEVLGDTVITYSDDTGDIVGYPLAGEGPRWTVPTDQPPLSITSAGDLFIISFVGLNYLESTINSQRVLPARVVAVEADGGRPRWQVYGYAISTLDGPVIAIGDGSATAQTVVGIDVRDGRELWREQLKGVPMFRSRAGGDLRNDEEIILGPDGSVQVLTLADGSTRPAGRVLPGTDPMFEVNGLLGVRLRGEHSTDDDTFLLYRLGDDHPLWQMPLPSDGPGLGPCGDQLCGYDSAGVHRFDILTGQVLEIRSAEAPDLYALAHDPWSAWLPGLATSHWEPIEMYKGHALVRLDPAFTKDTQTWLGDATLHGSAVSVRPLMPIGGRSNYCRLTERWLFCDGSAVEDAVAVRLSELDRLLGV